MDLAPLLPHIGTLIAALIAAFGFIKYRELDKRSRIAKVAAEEAAPKLTEAQVTKLGAEARQVAMSEWRELFTGSQARIEQLTARNTYLERRDTEREELLNKLMSDRQDEILKADKFERALLRLEGSMEDASLERADLQAEMARMREDRQIEREERQHRDDEIMAKISELEQTIDNLINVLRAKGATEDEIEAARVAKVKRGNGGGRKGVSSVVTTTTTETHEKAA